MNNSDKSVLSNIIAKKIKKRIIKGELKLNEQLPNELILADELNVSRTTIREAVKILVSKNVLRIERGKGTFIMQTPGLMEDPLGFEFLDNELLIHDLCEYRLILEPSVCKMASERATNEQLEEMENIIIEMKKVAIELEKNAEEKRNILLDKASELDVEFHALIYKMTNNTIFERLFLVVHNTVVENYLTILYRKGKSKLPFVETHEELFYAIKERKHNQAFKLSKEHLDIMSEELCSETNKGKV